MILSETSDFINRNSSATSDYYYNKIAYDEEQTGGGQFEKEDVQHVMQRFKIVDKKLKSLTVIGCILVFIACLQLICDFLSPSQTQIQTKRTKTQMTSEEDICQQGWSQCRCDVNTRSNVSQGFCQQIRLAHICIESDQLKTKSNPGKFLRKSSFSDFQAKKGVFWG